MSGVSASWWYSLMFRYWIVQGRKERKKRKEKTCANVLFRDFYMLSSNPVLLHFSSLVRLCRQLFERHLRWLTVGELWEDNTAVSLLN